MSVRVPHGIWEFPKIGSIFSGIILHGRIPAHLHYTYIYIYMYMSIYIYTYADTSYPLGSSGYPILSNSSHVGTGWNPVFGLILYTPVL